MSADFEAYGVPCFFANAAVAEPAGGRNVRVWNCVRRSSGVLVPVSEVIFPASDMLEAARTVANMAREVFNMEQMTVGAMVH